MKRIMNPSLHPAKCNSCSNEISDRYIMQIANECYHEMCLICCICGIHLAQTCFTRDRKLYCKFDYDRLYAKKCLGCSEKIPAEELVMRASDYIFHLRCFVCVVCGVPLQKGDQFIIKQGQLFCRPDYEKEVEMMQDFPPDFSFDDASFQSRSHDGRRGPKRPRTILTTQQRRAFKASFEISPKPCRKVRESLAKDTGLSVRIVQVWFQNQRAKMKKMQKKAKMENKSINQNVLNNNNNCSSNGSDSDCLNGDKVDTLKDEKSPENMMPHYINDSDTEQNIVLTRDNYYSRSMPFKDLIDNDVPYYKPQHLHQDEANAMLFPTSLGYMKPDDKDINLLHMIPNNVVSRPLEMSSNILMPGRLHGMSTISNAMMNPIDRLYSMNDTYFRAEEPSVMD
ncbi:LIM homeobox transcription factor 1-beta isoform X2 [Planococcus citri]|uniref:LIM homeobox transcription factor 1-beta isoform X2 n=1 Tax=Planococcus citri TaxID=170843 RepID=UPI0031F7851E